MLWYQSIPVWFQRLFPGLIWQKPESGSKVVYLTFDDGPHPEISVWIANLLQEHNVSATFFCVGDNVKRYPETYSQLLSMGHVMGNHTMHHIKGWNRATQTYIEDIANCSSLVDSDLFRPPYGRINKSQIKALKNDYRIIMWSLLSCDYVKNLKINKAIRGLKRKTRNGSIVVFHDSVKAEKNMKQLLPPYLAYLKENGYTCKTL